MATFICFKDQGSTGYLNLDQIISVYISPSFHEVAIETTTRSEQHRHLTLVSEDAKEFLSKWNSLWKGL